MGIGDAGAPCTAGYGKLSHRRLQTGLDHRIEWRAAVVVRMVHHDELFADVTDE